MAARPPTSHTFGPFELSIAQRSLRSNGLPLALHGRAFDLLVALVRARRAGGDEGRVARRGVGPRGGRRGQPACARLGAAQAARAGRDRHDPRGAATSSIRQGRWSRRPMAARQPRRLRPSPHHRRVLTRRLSRPPHPPASPRPRCSVATTSSRP